jgi:hypothetical protein
LATHIGSSASFLVAEYNVVRVECTPLQLKMASSNTKMLALISLDDEPYKQNLQARFGKEVPI